MKRIFLGIAICLILAAFFLHTFSTKKALFSTHFEENGSQPGVGTLHKSKTLFVPYWTVSSKIFPREYDSVAYFGITANEEGINTHEDGYVKIRSFMASVQPNQKTLLTIRLFDPTANEKVLHDRAFQQKVIAQSISIAKEYGFSGVMLDLEYKALAFDEVVHSVTNFSSNFAAASHSDHLSFYQTLYGDTFYRLRPFDAKAIGNVSDGIFLMAYDFHKVNGNPGPNFPLHEMSDESYSFTQMIRDFTQEISAKKLTIIFGLFGYDWLVGNNDTSLQKAAALTTAEARNKFLPDCNLAQCIYARNNQAGEVKVTYVDTSKKKHETWYEDMESIHQKEELLLSKGISSTAFWAWGYF